MTNEWRGVPGGDWPDMLAQIPALPQEDTGTGRRTATATKVAKKTGSAMSDKQIARAAVQGQRLIFRTVAFTPMDGYVVGMDDYHWLIASPGEQGEPVETTLIHKTCPLVSFTDTYLADEPDEDRKEIQRIGRPFWESCMRLGLAPATSNQEPQK
jgi:hypothetical protein